MNDDPQASGLWNQTPDGTRVLTVPCQFCGIPADLTEPEHGFNILTEEHEACRTRADEDVVPESEDPDWRWDEGLL